MPPEPESAPQRECFACGAWHIQSTCPGCGEPRGAPSGRPTIRVLQEVVLGPAGVLAEGRLICARMPWLASDAALQAHVRALLKEHSADWMQLAGALDALFARTIADGLARVLGISAADIATSVRSSFHLIVQQPGAAELPGALWRVTPFETSVAEGGSKLDPSLWGVDTTDVSVRPYARLPQSIEVTSPSVVVVHEVGWCAGDAKVARLLLHQLVVPGETARMALPPLTTRSARPLVTADVAPKLEFQLQGREDPLLLDVPPSAFAALPPPRSRAVVLIERGEAQLKLLWMMGSGDTLEAECWMADVPERLTRELGLPALGTDLLAWTSAALPCLARLALERFGRWLDRVVMLTSVAEASAIGESETCRASASEHILSGQVEAIPRAERITDTLASAAGALVLAEDEHERACHESTAQFHRRIEAWHKQVAASRDPLWGLITSSPGDAPDPPPDYAPLGLMNEALRAAFRHPSRAIVVAHADTATLTMTRLGSEGPPPERSWHMARNPTSSTSSTQGTPRAEAWSADTHANVGEALAWAAPPQGAPIIVFLSGDAVQSPHFRDALRSRILAHPGVVGVLDRVELREAYQRLKTLDLRAPALEVTFDIDTPSGASFDAMLGGRSLW